jgi:hypothetical protein
VLSPAVDWNSSWRNTCNQLVFMTSINFCNIQISRLIHLRVEGGHDVQIFVHTYRIIRHWALPRDVNMMSCSTGKYDAIDICDRCVLSVIVGFYNKYLLARWTMIVRHFRFNKKVANEFSVFSMFSKSTLSLRISFSFN